MNENYTPTEAAAYRAGMRAARNDNRQGAGEVATYKLVIRDEAPADEVRNALQRFAANYPMSMNAGRSSDGRIILWSNNAWNVGYLVGEEEE